MLTMEVVGGCIRIDGILNPLCNELSTTHSFMLRLRDNVLDICELRREDYLAHSPNVQETIGALRQCIKTVKWLTLYTEHNLLQNENTILESQVNIYSRIIQLLELERDQGLNSSITIARFRHVLQPLSMTLARIDHIKKLNKEISLKCDRLSAIAALINYEDNVKKIET